jgi:hypothetical protein
MSRTSDLELRRTIAAQLEAFQMFGLSFAQTGNSARLGRRQRKLCCGTEFIQ